MGALTTSLLSRAGKISWPGSWALSNSSRQVTATSSTGGIFGAIAADRTLGGVVDHTFVKSMSDYGDIEVTQDVMHLGCTYLVECWST